MDALVVVLLCFFLAVTNTQVEKVPEALQPQVQQAQVAKLNPMLNPSMYHDELAFMQIANELGFY